MSTNGSSATNGILKKGKVAVDDIEIYYEIRGTGDHVVLFLPGALGTCTTDFMKQYEGFDHGKFTLVTWDPPGHGNSRPPNRIQWIEKCHYYRKDADTALKFMDILGYNHYSVIGFSDGGRTGLIMSAKDPSKIRKAVAWGCNSYITNPEKEVIRSIRNVNLWAEEVKRPLINIYGNELQAIWSKLSDCWVSYDNVFREDLPLIQCPVFIFHGDKDPMVAKHHPEFFKSNIKRCRTHHFPFAGHNLQQTHYKDFNSLVQEFLEA